MIGDAEQQQRRQFPHAEVRSSVDQLQQRHGFLYVLGMVAGMALIVGIVAFKQPVVRGLVLAVTAGLGLYGLWALLA